MPGAFTDTKKYEALDTFSIERGLGYSILKYPLTQNMFELYSYDVSQSLRDIQNYLRDGRFIEARDIAKRIMNIYSHSPFIANLEAELEYQCGKAQDAKKKFERILNQWPYHVNAMNNLAAIEVNTGYPGRARALFERVLEIDPGNEDAIASLNEMGKPGL